MGAKTAMCVALSWPNKVANLIPVDNAPVDAALKSDFGTFVQGMREVANRQVTKQSEADEILKPYAKVLSPHFIPSLRLSNPQIMPSLDKEPAQADT
jgi:hypothetical protein